MSDLEKEILKLKIDIATLKGTFIGVLEGILFNKIEDALREKIEIVLKGLRQEDK